MDSVTDYLADAAARFDRAVDLGRIREAAFIARKAVHLYPDEPGAEVLLDRAARLCSQPKRTFLLTKRRQKARRHLLSLLACSVLVAAVVLSLPRAADVALTVAGLRGRSHSRRIRTWLQENPEHPDHARDLAAALQIHGDFGLPFGGIGRIDRGRLRALQSSYGLLSVTPRSP